MEILEIVIQTDRLLETEVFYTSVLRFEVVGRGEGAVSFGVGRSVLTFVDGEMACYHFAFNVPCNRFEEAMAWAAERVGLIEVPGGGAVADFSAWNAKSVYFYDNNGSVLEFIARFDLGNGIEGVFDVSSIECVSEIGIVCEEPLVFAEGLVGEYGVPYFGKWRKSEDFVVLGDDNGLFIVVKVGRNWYPTSLRAERYYVRVRFLVEGMEKVLEMGIR